MLSDVRWRRGTANEIERSMLDVSCETAASSDVLLPYLLELPAPDLRAEKKPPFAHFLDGKIVLAKRINLI